MYLQCAVVPNRHSSLARVLSSWICMSARFPSHCLSLSFCVTGAVFDARSAHCSGLCIEISGFLVRRAPPRAFLSCLVAMDVSDMPDLGALEDAQMLMQDADSILHPPDDNEVESTPATATKRRISVSDLWSQTATPSLLSDDGSGVALALPDPSSQMSIAPRLRLDCLFEAEFSELTWANLG